MSTVMATLKSLASKTGFDAYDLQARVFPIAFAASPVVLVAIALVPGLGQAKLAGGTVAAFIVAAVSFIGSRFARSAGRARQARLFAAWDGKPTTTMLRYRDTRVNARTKELYRDRLRRLGSSFPIPDKSEEQRDPQEADAKIEAAMDEVRQRAKACGLKSVRRENINYGAHRNAYGLKPFGLTVAAVAIITLSAAVVREGEVIPNPLDLAVGAGLVLIILLWLFGCTAAHVRQHAEAYALELFEAIDTLVPAARKSGGGKPAKRSTTGE